MRYFTIVLAALLLTACNTTPSGRKEPRAVNSPTQAASEPQTAAPDTIVQFLLKSAAADFHAHGPAGSLRFRNVRIGHTPAPGGKHQYMLCGEFLRAEVGTSNEWMHFTTVKTSGYEQYVGSRVSSFCQDSSAVWDSVNDLSSMLQSRLDSLR